MDAAAGWQILPWLTCTRQCRSPVFDLVQHLWLPPSERAPAHRHVRHAILVCRPGTVRLCAGTLPIVVEPQPHQGLTPVVVHHRAGLATGHAAGDAGIPFGVGGAESGGGVCLARTEGAHAYSRARVQRGRLRSVCGAFYGISFLQRVLTSWRPTDRRVLVVRNSLMAQACRLGTRLRCLESLLDIASG